MDAQMANVRMSKICPMEIDIDQYPHARRMAAFIVGIVFFLCLQIIMQVVIHFCNGGGPVMAAFTLAGWSGILPTMVLGVVAARRMMMHRTDAMFLCKSFGWLLLCFKMAALVAIPLVFGVFDLTEVVINFVWVVAIMVMIWSQYGSPELMSTFPRKWRVVSGANVLAVVFCALSMVGLPALCIAFLLRAI